MVKVELLYKNGDLYYGEVVEGQLEGKGVYRFKDGSSYEGEFKKNVFNGRGKLIDVFNEVTIVGEFQDGLAYGQCNISYSDGSTY